MCIDNVKKICSNAWNIFSILFHRQINNSNSKFQTLSIETISRQSFSDSRKRQQISQSKNSLQYNVKSNETKKIKINIWKRYSTRKMCIQININWFDRLTILLRNLFHHKIVKIEKMNITMSIDKITTIKSKFERRITKRQKRTTSIIAKLMKKKKRKYKKKMKMRKERHLYFTKTTRNDMHAFISNWITLNSIRLWWIENKKIRFLRRLLFYNY